MTGEPEDPAIKFLGLYIDPGFNFKFHVQTICKKISSSLYFLRTAKNVLNTKALTSLYYSLVHSYLIYAIQVWTICPQSSFNSVFKLQKKAIRIIHDLPYNGHTESYFKKSNILPLPKLTEFFKLQFMQQFSQGFLPYSFNNVWTTNAARASNERPYLLRNNDDLYVPPSRLSITQKHPYYLFPKSWLDFNEHEIKIQRDKCTFNTMLKKYFMNQLSDNYVCTRLLCPRCHIPSPFNSPPFSP